MKIKILKSVYAEICQKLGYEDVIEKARKGEQVAGSKYLFRTSNPKGGWIYTYLKDFLIQPLKTLEKVFKITEKQITEKYEKENIQKDFGADKKTFAQHLLEYFGNREKWDSRFAKKENADKFKKPIKMKDSEKTPEPKGMESEATKLETQENGQLEFDFTGKTTKATKKDTKWKANPSLMRRIWSMYTGKAIEQQEKNEQIAEKVIEQPTVVENTETKIEKVTESEIEKLYNSKKADDLLNTPKDKISTLSTKDLITIIAMKSTQYHKDIKAGVKNANSWAERGREEILAEYFKDKETVKKRELKDAETKLNQRIESFAEQTNIHQKINRIESLITDLFYYANVPPISILPFTGNQGMELDLSNDKLSKIQDVLKNFSPEIQEKVNNIIDSIKKYNGQKFTLNQIIGKEEWKETEAEAHANRSQAMLGNQNAKKYGLSEELYNYTTMIMDKWNLLNNPVQQNMFLTNISRKFKDDVKNALKEGEKTKDFLNIVKQIYNDRQGVNNGADNIERDRIPDDNGNIRNGESDRDSGSNVLETESAANESDAIDNAVQSGIGLTTATAISGNTERIGRVKKSQAIKIREKCREILASKSDDEMTEEDKAILSQYEGAGGLGEKGQTSKAVLTEFYTPRDVIAKIWQIVDKYNPKQDKKVLEPSSGIGRFAEGRNEKFTFCEIDETSARIAKILHPEADVKQGAFQESMGFIKNNAVTKGYSGEKFDCAVGNPPYMAYNDFYSGLDKKNIHTRYEEYFMDKTLDTLKDGGVMAFVVPAGFLRSGNSKAKEMIASKGKLVEAYRLPKGTFSSTDIGTDIVVIQKGKGNVEDFNDNKYFTDNMNHIIGSEIDSTDRFGNPTKIVIAPKGKTIEEAINSIDTNAVEVQKQVEAIVDNVKVEKQEEPKIADSDIVEPTKPKSKICEKLGIEYTLERDTKSGKIHKAAIANDKFWEWYNKDKTSAKNELAKNNMYVIKDSATRKWLVCTTDITESEAEKHANRSRAMLGNDNAKKLVHAERKKKSAEGELFTPSIGENMTSEQFNQKYSRNIPKDYVKYWKYINWEGKIQLDDVPPALRDEFLKSEDFIQVGSYFEPVNLYASGNIYKKLDEINKEIERYGEEYYKRHKSILESVLPEKKNIFDVKLDPKENFITQLDGGEFVKDFRKWLYNRNTDLKSYLELYNVSLWDITDYMNGKAVRSENKDDPKANELKNLKSINRKLAAEEVLKKYISTLPEDKVKEIEDRYNRKFNAFVNPDFSKIPLFVDGMNTHKGTMEFTLTDQQIEGVSRLCNKGNGILAYDVGVGKAQPLTANIATPNGFVKMGDIKVGDSVIAVDGSAAKVIGVYPKGIKKIYKVTFSDGSYTECCNEHLWTVCYSWARNKSQNKEEKDGWVTKELQELENDILNNRGQYKLSIPITAPVQFNARKLKLNPYVMGCLIGDGGFSTKAIRFTTADDFILNEIKNNLPEDTEIKQLSKYDYRITNGKTTRNKETGKFEKTNKIYEILEYYGLANQKSYEKFIPNDYKYTCIEDRIELLRGLFDTNGTVNKHGDVIQLYTTSQKLIEDVKDVINSLGGTVSIHSKQGKYKDKENNIHICRVCYTLTIRIDGINLFKLPRKADKVKNKSKYKPIRFIKAVEYVGDKEAQCIMVDHKDHLYLTDNYIVTHNTATGIVATINQIQTGAAKKPLICVPKAVYKNWIKEIKQLFPNQKINELSNLNAKQLAQFKDENGKINLPEGALNICTYEGLENITFKPETISGELSYDMTESQSVYDRDSNGNLLPDERSPRQIESEKEKIQKMLGMSAQTKEGAVFFEDLGIDHITVDELHNFKNIFSLPRAYTRSNKSNEDKKEEAKEGNANEYSGIQGATSKRGMKLFAISQLIQNQTNGKGFFGLSATPFNNSPVEIYNILSLVARNRLKEMDIFNMKDFMDDYAEFKMDKVVTAKGNVEQKKVMKSFKKLDSLQNLLTEFIDKVDGEEAGVIRPFKNVHLPELDLSPLQQIIMKVERERIEGKLTSLDEHGKPKKTDATTLVAINNMRMACLSPSLIDPKFYSDYAKEPGWHEPKAEDIVKESPKLTFVCDSVVKQFKERPTEGQVIYMPRGVGGKKSKGADDDNFADNIQGFEAMKKYLASKGVPADSVAFLRSDTNLDEKERIMNDYNDPNGKIKVIIGSETIKEGVNLNGNSTTLYNTMLGWNPTETTQVEGRIWRQGNKQGITHIVYPLMNDSIDAMMYQKYDEKSSRLNALWNYKGNSLNVEDINPEEMKLKLIKDPKVRAKMRIDEDVSDKDLQLRQLNVTYDDLEGTRINYEQLQDEIKRKASDENMKYHEETISNAQDDVKNAEKELKEAKKTGNDVSRAEWKLQNKKDFLTRVKSAAKANEKRIDECKKTIKSINAYWKQNGLKNVDEVQKRVEQISTQRQTLKAEIDELKKPETMEKLVAEASEQIRLEEANVKHATVSEQVQNVTQSIKENILPMDNEWRESLKKIVEAKRAKNDKAAKEATEKLYDRFPGLKKSLFIIHKGKFYVRKKL